MAKYPLTVGNGYELQKTEIDLNGKIYTAINNISSSQPIEEGWAWGAAPEPLLRTVGQLQPGSGTIEWSDMGEMQEFIDDLGDGWQQKPFKATLTYTAEGRPTIRRTLVSCRLLDAEEDHAAGPDPLGGSMPFSFMYRLMNGKKSLINQRI